jgi:LysM repeat protein
MRGLREFGNALIVTIISVGLVFGALSISLVEFASVPTPTDTPPALLPPTNTFSPGATLDASPIPQGSTPTGAIVSSACQPPAGWVAISIQAGETLNMLAARYRTSLDELRRGNCLLSDSLIPGKVFFVPPAPTSTSAACIPGAVGWVKLYVVRPGDTLYSIAVNHYTTVGLLKSVNCRTSDRINSGEVLWVPNVSTRTPIPTPLPGTTVTPHPTDPLTETALPFTATFAPTHTPASTLTFTSTPTVFPTNTP